MMNLIRTIIVSVIFFAVINGGCVSVQGQRSEPPAKNHNVIIPPMKYVGPEGKKHWEGDIDGRSVSYFRLKNQHGISDVLVITQDDLPGYFKRIEYLDKDGDGNADVVRMSIYEKAKGWRDVGISKDNKYGLAYADIQFKELLRKITEAREAKKQ
jgi:hypothetical protein